MTTDAPNPAPKDPPIRRVAILGAGQMGLVCAQILANPEGAPASATPAGHASSAGDAPPEGAGGAGAEQPEVVLWGHGSDEVGALTQTRRSPRLDHFVLPDAVRVTGNLAEAVRGADLVVNATPVQFLRGVWAEAAPAIEPGAGVVSFAKGIENSTILRPSQIIADVLPDDPDQRPRPIGVLSGPTIAAELARCLPATMVAASDHPGFAERLQNVFATSWLRIYTHEDMLGVELAGATKNVIAIAAGVLDGLQAGYNAKSALLARGLAEITRLGVAMGASAETFFGLAGVGDLATTCFSPEGRNRSLGEALGKGETLAAYLARTTSVVEGVATTKSVMALAERYRVEMPITAGVHAVLYDAMDPLDCIGRLMARELKRERVG